MQDSPEGSELGLRLIKIIRQKLLDALHHSRVLLWIFYFLNVKPIRWVQHVRGSMKGGVKHLSVLLELCLHVLLVFKAE